MIEFYAYSVSIVRLSFGHPSRRKTGGYQKKIRRGEEFVSRHLIVDGYNLARSGAVFLPDDPAGPEGRAQLCALVAGYVKEKGFRLTVVFDGRGAGNPERARLPFKGGTALFSSRHESADDVIRDLSRNAPAGTIVVTSDRGLRGTLPARGVTVVSCEEFADRLAVHRMEGEKGADEEEEREGRRKGKKGEGQRRKKRERERNRILRKL